MQRGTTSLTKRQVLEARQRSGRSFLMTIPLFTVINSVLMLLKTSFYFLFSATLPHHLLYLAMYLTGKRPAAEYEGYGSPDGPMWLLWAAIGFMVFCAAVYVVLWIFSKNRPAVLLVGAIVFFLDTLSMLLFYPALFTFSASAGLDVVIHVLILVFMIMGVVAGFKLKKLPPDEPEQPAGYPDEGETPAEQFAPEQPCGEAPQTPDRDRDDRDEFPDQTEFPEQEFPEPKFDDYEPKYNDYESKYNDNPPEY